jgi:hypothetical protein
MSEREHPRGLTSGEAARRLRELGPPKPPETRSVAGIVAGNVFTLFNAIIGAFFVLMLALGLFADALFGLIAVINSAIGIRQELKARRPWTSWPFWSRRGRTRCGTASRSSSWPRRWSPVT